MVTRAHVRTFQSDHNRRRMRRAFSWLERSEQADTTEAKFIFLWIAFNAAYGDEASDAPENQLTENLKIRNFFREILKRDPHKEIEHILLEKHSGAVRVFLENHFVFRLFWRWVRDPSRGFNWRKGFESNGERIRNALEERDVQAICEEVFRRLYELRNQIFHGGVNFAEGWVQTQLRDGTRIIADVMPVVLEIMQADIDADPASEVWGPLAYPQVRNHEHRELRDSISRGA